MTLFDWVLVGMAFGLVAGVGFVVYMAGVASGRMDRDMEQFYRELRRR